MSTEKRWVLGASLAALLFFVGGACGGEVSQEWRQVAAEAARAESLVVADAAFEVARFDTISWSSDYARSERGSVVWESSCATCHGVDGAGRGDLALEQELDVPSFIEPQWLYDGDVPQIRFRTFVGHGPDMPSWGLHELQLRDVDAVAFFITTRLRER